MTHQNLNIKAHLLGKYSIDIYGNKIRIFHTPLKKDRGGKRNLTFTISQQNTIHVVNSLGLQF